MRIRFDPLELHHHFHSEDADSKREAILRAIHLLGVTMAKTFAELKADLQQKLDANLAAVEANTAVDQSIITLLEGYVRQNADLKQQILDAIAAGGDPSSLQPIVDALEAQNAVLTASTQKTVTAVTANTPAE